jgi:hypothetical protein
VPDPHDHLGNRGVLEVEPLNEGQHVGSVRRFSSVVVSPLGGVAEKRGVPKGRSGLPMPLPWVPWEVLDESSFKNPT